MPYEHNIATVDHRANDASQAKSAETGMQKLHDSAAVGSAAENKALIEAKEAAKGGAQNFLPGLTIENIGAAVGKGAAEAARSAGEAASESRSHDGDKQSGNDHSTENPAGSIKDHDKVKNTLPSESSGNGAVHDHQKGDMKPPHHSQPGDKQGHEADRPAENHKGSESPARGDHQKGAAKLPIENNDTAHNTHQGGADKADNQDKKVPGHAYEGANSSKGGKEDACQDDKSHQSGGNNTSDAPAQNNDANRAQSK